MQLTPSQDPAWLAGYETRPSIHRKCHVAALKCFSWAPAWSQHSLSGTSSKARISCEESPNNYSHTADTWNEQSMNNLVISQRHVKLSMLPLGVWEVGKCALPRMLSKVHRLTRNEAWPIWRIHWIHDLHRGPSTFQICIEAMHASEKQHASEPFWSFLFWQHLHDYCELLWIA